MHFIYHTILYIFFGELSSTYYYFVKFFKEAHLGQMCRRSNGTNMELTAVK